MIIRRSSRYNNTNKIHVNHVLYSPQYPISFVPFNFENRNIFFCTKTSIKMYHKEHR